MFFKHLQLPEPTEAWLNPSPEPLTHRRGRLSKRKLISQTFPDSSTPQSSITWQMTTNCRRSQILTRTTIKSLQRKLSFGKNKLKENGTNGDIQDDQDMSESARIAFAYRTSHKLGVHVPDDTSATRQTPRELMNNRHTICPTATVPFSESEPRSKTKSTALSDVLCTLSPAIIERVGEDERCRAGLRYHRSVSNAIVLESQWPNKTPHIVITPPPERDVLEAPFIAQDNRISLQYRHSLTVPPLNIVTCRMMNEDWCRTFHLPPLLEGYVNQTRTHGAQLVFNYQTFVQRLKQTKESKNGRHCSLLMPAVMRHLLKASAVTASLLAPSFRARYDMPEFVASLEYPFRWTDPAEALLSLHRVTVHPIGVHCIPSPEPFSVPHILIEESLGNDQKVVDENVAPIQDPRGKDALVVTCSKIASGFLSGIEAVSLDYDSSTCDSPLPETPTEGKVNANPFAWDSGRISGYFTNSLQKQSCYWTKPGTLASQKNAKALFFIEEDDEDEFI